METGNRMSQGAKKEYLKSESPQNYEREFTQEEKDNLFKEIYSNIDMFKKLIGKAAKYNDSGRSS